MLRPCQFYESAPEHIFGERMCGLPITHKLIFGDGNSIDDLEACTIHFLLMLILMRIMRRYLHYKCLHKEDKTHSYF